MADAGKPGPLSTPEVRNASALSGGVLPYVIAALMAATAMAWYFFIFVPEKMNYFVGLRFRTLAVAAGHVKSKADSLAQALNVGLGVTPVQSNTTPDALLSEYLRLVVPDIQNPAIHGTEAVSCGPKAQGLDICAHGDRTAAAQVAWSDVVPQAVASSRPDFDDLLLANDEGNVLWQREISTPRIGNLSELLAAQDQAGGLLSFSWHAHATVPVAPDKKHLVSTATLKHVNLGGTSYELLVQAISVMLDGSAQPRQPPATLYVAGLVSEAALQNQAMQIPMVWIVGLTLPVALLFLALPFVKLATLMPKERYAFPDIVALMVATIATAGLGAILPLLSYSSSSADPALERLTGQVRTNFNRETINILRLASGIREGKGLQPATCEIAASGISRASDTANPGDRRPESAGGECNLWNTLKSSPDVELDVAVWIDNLGNQVQKWSTKTQITGRARHRSFQHFHDLIADDLWTVSDETNTYRFTIEPLRSPTTSELGVFFALRSSERNDGAKDPALNLVRQPDAGATKQPEQVEPQEFFGVNVRPQSVVDPIVPPGYGFAILAPDGKVLFHSQEGLSLEENFFEEVGDPAEVRATAQSGRPAKWNGDYHGRPHRIRMEPLGAFKGNPWLIVGFQELQPVLDAEVLHQSGTLRLGLVSLGVLAVLALLAACYFRVKQRRSRDLMQAVLAGGLSDIRHLVVLAALGGLELLAIVSTSAPSTYPWLSWTYVLCFVAVPVAGIVACVTVRCKTVQRTHSPRSESSNTESRWAAAVRALPFDPSLGLLLMVVGVLPAIGFVRAVHAVQDTRANQRWIETVERGLLARRARVEQRITHHYASPTGEQLRTQLTTDAVTNADNKCRDATYSYLTVLDSPPEPCVRQADDLQTPTGILPFILDWNFFDAVEQRGTTPGVSPAVHAAVTAIARRAGDRREPWFAWSLGTVIMLCSLLGVYWARRRVLPRVFAAAPSLHTVITQVDSAGKGGMVLLIGPPRTKKDEIVNDVINEVTKARPAFRVPLLGATLTDDFMREQRLKLDRAMNDPPRVDHPTIWVHLSNLEVQLVDQTSRTQVLRLMTKLLENPPTRPVALVITTCVDPIAHFKELFTDERRDIYNDHVPEIALSTAALILSRCRRCFEPLGTRNNNDIRLMWDQWRDYDPSAWEETLERELSAFAPLKPIYSELKAVWAHRKETPEKGVPLDELLRGIRAQTLPFYELLWTSCTRDEKLVLIQLAQEGFITAQCWDVAATLVAKGLIVNEPFFAIFNRTFRDFLIDTERNDVIQEWERTEGRGLWVTAGRLIGSSVVAGGIFYLLTQDVSVQSLIPVVSGTGLFGTPIVRSLLARFSGKTDASAA